MAIDRRATRLGVLGLVGVILFSLIGVRLWFLQTVKADELQELSTFASTRTVQIPPERGRIFDVDGRILADNQRILTVAVDWQQLRKRTDRLEIFRRLSAWVGVPIEDMEARFRVGRRQPVPADADQAGDRRADRGSAARTLARTSPACTSSPSGGACIRTHRTPSTSSATWARSRRTSGTTSCETPATCSTSGSASSASRRAWSRCCTARGAARSSRSTPPTGRCA